MIKAIVKLWCCYLWHDHDWTCNAEQGIDATPEQLKDANGFFDYAKMYCKRCGTVSESSKRFMQKGNP